MMKKSMTYLWMLLAVASVHAETILPDEALSIATRFAQGAAKASGLRSAADVVSLVEQVYASDGYYAFNVGTDDGFVLVATDDAARSTVLGYADAGHFNYDELSDDARWWLGLYDEQVKTAGEAAAQAAARRGGQGMANVGPSATLPYPNRGTVVVAPLLTTTWEQSGAFSTYCNDAVLAGIDSENAPCGCLALAAAQIMNYYEWPAQGTGSNSYSYTYGNKTINVSGNFNHVYDWANMRDTYGYRKDGVYYNFYYSEKDNTYYYSSKQPLDVTPAQEEAVAVLLRDVGIAFDMEYKQAGSGAVAYDAVVALCTNFGYKKSMALHQRTPYSTRQWEDMLRAELDAHRPVLYGGAKESGAGHAFVCDGYDDAGYFHFNWGWRGKADGYFLTSALNPNTSDLGAAGEAYVNSQNIITGIEPCVGEDYSGPRSLQVYATNLEIADTKNISYKVHVSLLSAEDIKFYLCLENVVTGSCTYQETTKHDFTTKEAAHWTFTYSGYNSMSVGDGIYRLYPAYGRKSANYAKAKMGIEEGSAPAMMIQVARGKKSFISQSVDENTRFCCTANNTALLLPDRYEGSVEVPATVTIEDTELPVTEVAYGAFADSYALDDVTLHRNLDLSKAKVPNETAVTLDIVDGDRLDWTDNAASYDRIRYTRRFADYGTLVLPFDVSAETLAEAGLKVYALSESGLTFDEAESIVAGTPYFYVDETYDGQDIAKTLETADVTVAADVTAGMTESDGWRMTGTFNKFYETGDWGDEPPYYGLGNDYQLKGATRSITVWPYRAYFTIKDGAAIQAITLRSNDGSTSVISLSGSDGSANANANADDVYDLQGRKVTNPSAGLYIVNGKKVFLQ